MLQRCHKGHVRMFEAEVWTRLQLELDGPDMGAAIGHANQGGSLKSLLTVLRTSSDLI